MLDIQAGKEFIGLINNCRLLVTNISMDNGRKYVSFKDLQTGIIHRTNMERARRLLLKEADDGQQKSLF